MSAKYDLIRRIERTQSGEIYEAKEIKSGATVAIKISRPIKESKTTAEDPLEEILVMEKLRKEEVEENGNSFADGRQHIIKFLDTYIQTYKGLECNFNVMEYAEGGDFLDKIQKEEIRSIDSVQRYFRMIVKGVSYLHKRNISHLDLSLENVLLMKNDEIKICDFGQAQIGRIFKSSGIRRGKLKYMSPEVFQRVEEYDGFKADLWSLGVILWILLTRAFCYNAPCKVDKRFQYLARGKSGIEMLLHISKADQSEEVVDLLTKIFSVDPIERPTVHEILEHSWLIETIPPSSIVSLESIQMETTPVSLHESESISDSTLMQDSIITYTTLSSPTSIPSVISVCSDSFSMSLCSSSSSSYPPPFSPTSFPPPPPVVAEAPSDEPSTFQLPPSLFVQITRTSTTYSRSLPGSPMSSSSSFFSEQGSNFIANPNPTILEEFKGMTKNPYGPLRLKRSKSHEKQTRRRRHSLFRHVSEHRKL